MLCYNPSRYVKLYRMDKEIQMLLNVKDSIIKTYKKTLQ